MTRPGSLLRSVPGSVFRFPLVAALLALTGCGGFDVVRTDFDTYTVTASGDGALYEAFQARSLKLCPQGFYQLKTFLSPAGESRYAAWQIRCSVLVIHGGE